MEIHREGEMIEAARSGRARCRSCGEKIARGELRFGKLDRTFSRRNSYRWFHLACAAKEYPNRLEQSLEQFDGEIPGAAGLHEAIAQGREGGGRRRSVDGILEDLAGIPPADPCDIFIYNEATCFSVTASATAGRALRWSAGGGEPPDAHGLAASGGVLQVELRHDDPFMLRVVVGRELSAEEARWVGRAATRLRIPCAQLMIWPSHFLLDELSDVLEDGWQPGDHYVPHLVRVPRGDYRVDCYAYINGVNGPSCVDEATYASWREGAPHEAGIDFLLQLRPLDRGRDQELTDWGGTFPPDSGVRAPASRSNSTTRVSSGT